VGLAAARRAVRVAGGPAGPLRRPLLVEVVPPANIAVGTVPWGLEAWVPADSIVRLGVGTGSTELAETTDGALAAAAGRPLVVVVRDAHRYPSARDVVTRLLAARPDAVVVEMGLPVWRPSRGVYVATYGAALISGLAAAEVLGLVPAPTPLARADRASRPK
jgi:beta-N-acetylhexosaminidase